MIIISQNAIMQIIIPHKTNKSFIEMRHFLETIMLKCCYRQA